MKRQRALRKRRIRVRYFSIAELTAAMAILLFVMYILFRFVGGAQRLWEQSRTNAEIYERAGLFFDVVTRDLKSMVTSNVPDEEINYSPSACGELPANIKLALVTESGIGAGATGPLAMEVGYEFDATENRVIRKMSRYSDGAVWDFYDASAATWGASWNGANDAELADGVNACSFRVYSQGGATPTEITVATQDTTVTPAFVVISIELFDPRQAITGATGQGRSLRRFTKTIFLNQ